MYYNFLFLLIGSFCLNAAQSFAQSNFQENDFLNNTRQLIFEGKRSGEGYFSADGRYLVFQSERLDDNPFYQIYSLDFDSGDVQQISPGSGKTTCAFYQGGTNHILFSSSHRDPQAKAKQKAEIDFRNSGKERRYSWDYEPEMDIFLSDNQGNILQQLTQSYGYDAEASFSPDGKKIVFCSNRNAFNGKLNAEDSKRLEYDPAYFGDIYIMNADGSNVQQLTTTAGYDGGPFFSPDGKRIIWRHFNESGMLADIYTMKTDGSDVKRITDFNAMSWAPFYHPSGDYIIFASNKLGFENFELYITAADGSTQPVRVTFTDGFDGLPVFSPDGKTLVWTSNRTADAKAQLFIANWSDANARQALANAAPLHLSAQQTTAMHLSDDATREDFVQWIEYLANDALEGRMTGSVGIHTAADFISQQWQQQGLQPLPNQLTYALPFQFVSGVEPIAENTTFGIRSQTMRLGETYQIKRDYLPLSFSDNGQIEGNIVFVAYGLKTPEGNGIPLNDYANVDVTDKIVLVFDGLPAGFDEETRLELERYGATHYKAMIAREMGAKGIIFIQEKLSENLKAERGSSGIVALEILPETAKRIFALAEQDFAVVEKKCAAYNPHAAATYNFPEHLRANIQVEMKKQYGTDNNLVAMLPAKTADAPYIVIGAHYDHLGYGEEGSRAIAGEEHQIHNGADDNASGTAMILELAAYYANLYKKDATAFDKNMVFALWSGEELGLIGSENFVKNSPIPLEKVAAYFNYDMVGRLKDNQLILQGVGSAKEWKSFIEKKNVRAGFQLTLSNDPYLPTDATSFYKAGVPTISFFTGLHDDYHRPTDDANLINYDGVVRIAAFSETLLKEVQQNTLTYEKVTMSKQQASARGFSVYLGTIPDYGADVEGVKLSGVRAGSPADKAGLQDGDVIISLNDKEIKNIYDYTYILGDLKPNEAVSIQIMRNKERMMLQVTPIAK
ncbi:MAG: M28 family peptidase [Chitinophagales bacterium]|nr:M28 family peptidase [Bacteroidota bacterium]